MSLTEFLLNKYKNDFESITILPSSGGVFEVTFNDELIFSKKELGRFPSHEEIQNLIEE